MRWGIVTKCKMQSVKCKVQNAKFDRKKKFPPVILSVVEESPNITSKTHKTRGCFDCGRSPFAQHDTK